MEEKSGKLSLGHKLAYSMGGFGEAVPNNLFFIYFLYFLTNVAGVAPSIAGAIAMLAVLWDAITDPVIGVLSDRCTGRLGRRRTIMAASILPLALAIYLLFAPIPLTGTVQVVFYIAVCMLFWLALTMWVIPFFALGAEITTDYSERNTLRTLTMIFEYAVLLLCTAGPMWVLSYVLGHGGTEKQSWGYTAIISAVIVAVMCVICIAGTKGKDRQITKADVSKTKGNIFQAFKSLFKIRTYRLLCIIVIFAIMGLGLVATNLVYVLTYITNLSPAQQGVYWTIFSVISMVMLPIINFCCNKFGKRETLLVICLLQIINSMLFFFIGMTSFALLMVFSIIFIATNCSIMTMYIPLSYDSCEVDEFISGEKREGAIISIMAFIHKFAYSFTLWIAGVVLQQTGYDGSQAVQTPEALSGLSFAVTILPSICFVVAIIALIKYPVTKKRFEALQAALTKRKAGMEFNTEGFDKLLK